MSGLTRKPSIVAYGISSAKTGLFAELAGFSRQVVTFGIIHFLQIIYEQDRLLLPVVADRDGILIKSDADSLMIIVRRPLADRARATMSPCLSRLGASR